MPGLVVTIAGNLDASYRAALTESLGLARAAGLRMEAQQAVSLSRMRSQISEFNKFKMAVDAVRGHGMMTEEESNRSSENVRQAEVEEATRSNRARRLRRMRAEARAAAPIQGPDLDGVQRAVAAQNQIDDAVETATRANRARRLLRIRAENRAMRAKALAEEIADTKAQNLAAISLVARQGGIGVASGEHGHKYGGRGGVISEIAVIGHEALQGRGTGRILGSISILAQRLGLLGTLVKSTAAEEIKLAFAENEKAGAMARAAIATEASTVATQAEKDAAIAASVAQNAQAKSATEAAEMASASAKVTLGPLGWLLIAITAVVGMFFVFAKALKEYDRQARLLNETVATSITKFEDEREALDKANDAAIEFEKSLAKLNERHNQAVENSDEAVEALKRHAEATANLAEEKRKASLLDIEMQEKTGKIGKIAAIRKRADVEKQAVADKASAEIAAAKAELDQRATASAKGLTDAVEAQKKAQAANDVLNKSPESIARLQAFNFAKRKKEDADKAVVDAEKNLENEKHSLAPWANPELAQFKFDQAKGQAERRQAEFDSAKNALTPTEIAAESAKKQAEEASTASDNLRKAFQRSMVEYNAKVENAPAAIAAAQANISKQEKITEMGVRHGPDGLNAMQRLGAFTAQGGNPLVPLHVRTNALLAQLVAANLGWMNHQKNKQGGVTH